LNKQLYLILFTFFNLNRIKKLLSSINKMFRKRIIEWKFVEKDRNWIGGKDMYLKLLPYCDQKQNNERVLNRRWMNRRITLQFGILGHFAIYTFLIYFFEGL